MNPLLGRRVQPSGMLVGVEVEAEVVAAHMCLDNHMVAVVHMCWGSHMVVAGT